MRKVLLEKNSHRSNDDGGIVLSHSFNQVCPYAIKRKFMIYLICFHSLNFKTCVRNRSMTEIYERKSIETG